MDRNWVVASVVAGVAMHVVNWLAGMVPVDFFTANFAAAWTWQAVVGSVFAGAVLAMVLGWKGAGDASDAAKAGATLGVLHGIGTSIAGMEAFDVMGLIGAIVAGIVVYGAGGAAVAMAPSGGGDA